MTKVTKQKWSPEEEAALLEGVALYGKGKWRNIQKDPRFAAILATRSNIDLKDKFRNLNIKTGARGSQRKLPTVVHKVQQPVAPPLAIAAPIPVFLPPLPVAPARSTSPYPLGPSGGPSRGPSKAPSPLPQPDTPCPSHVAVLDYVLKAVGYVEDEQHDFTPPHNLSNELQDSSSMSEPRASHSSAFRRVSDKTEEMLWEGVRTGVKRRCTQDGGPWSGPFHEQGLAEPCKRSAFSQYGGSLSPADEYISEGVTGSSQHGLGQSSCTGVLGPVSGIAKRPRTQSVRSQQSNPQRAQRGGSLAGSLGGSRGGSPSPCGEVQAPQRGVEDDMLIAAVAVLGLHVTCEEGAHFTTVADWVEANYGLSPSVRPSVLPGLERLVHQGRLHRGHALHAYRLTGNMRAPAPTETATAATTAAAEKPAAAAAPEIGLQAAVYLPREHVGADLPAQNGTESAANSPRASQSEQSELDNAAVAAAQLTSQVMACVLRHWETEQQQGPAYGLGGCIGSSEGINSTHGVMRYATAYTH